MKSAPLPAADRTPRRVLMTTDTVGGVWHYAVELSRGLAPYGVEVVLAALGGAPGEAHRRDVDALPNVDLRESGYRLSWMEDPWDDVAASRAWLLALARETAPDLVHLNTFVHGDLAFEAPVLIVGHSCVYSWFAAVRGAPPPDARWGRYRTAVAAGLGGADRVTAPTRAMLTALHRHYGPFADGGATPNGRAADAYPPRPKEPFILTAGRLWDEAKNAAALAEVAPRLAWPVVAAGTPDHPDGTGTARFEHVRLLGRLAPEALAGWLGRAAIYALPARYEPFGLSALEAAHAGCALVLGDIPTLRELWDGAAVFVPPDDHDALADALSALIDDAGRREDLAARARRRAARYTPARMVRGYLAHYDALLAAAPAPTA